MRRPSTILKLARSTLVWTILALLCELHPCRAQAPLDDLIFTVGTAARSGVNDYSYVLLGTKEDALLAGKTFAVFGKPGDASSAASYTQRGVIQQRFDPTAVNALLNQSVTLGQDLPTLGDALNMLLRRVPGITNQTLANKIVTAFNVARTNAQTAMFVNVLARAHPAMSLAMGHAFTEQTTATTTYEIREVNPLTGAAGDVIGRVTVTPGAPVVMPTPGAPWQIVTNHPSDDLIIKLRWGTPDTLRRLSLLGYGFNVWRMPRAFAEANLFHTVPPTLSQLQANALRVNDAPVAATKLFSATGANDPADHTTTFFSDDNGRARHLGQPNVAMFTFTNGQEFYYFVTARDVLGRDGAPSPGGLGRACKRQPPTAPMGLDVTDHAITTNNAGVTNTIQRFLVTWPQTTNSSEGTTHYWIYRWANPASAFTNDLTPLSNRVGRVAHVADAIDNSFLDNTPASPTNPGPAVYWYTVRAVNEAACDPLLSPHSAPASGVLRERTGPAGTTGSVAGSCGTPALTVTNQSYIAAAETNRHSYRFVCVRRDPAIEWVTFYATNVTYYGYRSVQVFGPVYFGAENEVHWEPSAENGTRMSHVVAVAGTVNGQVSKPRTAFLNASSSITLKESVTFLAGIVLLTAADPFDPLIPEINTGYGGCYNVQSAQVDLSGVVFLTFHSYAGPAPLLIQSTTNGPNSTTWINVGTAFPDSNGVYSLSYPACLYGPLPTFRGCVLPLPANEDCTDAIVGTDAVGTAPLHIRFHLTPRTRQYRLYKQVDDGPLTLISQGATRFVSAARQLVIPDDSMPVVPTRICYYVQLLDEHGNASPMSFLGCKRVRRSGPARPVLAEPVAAGNITAPKVRLSWFCPTAGVSRFRVIIEEVNKPVDSTAPSRFSGTLLRRQSSAYPVGARFATRVSSALKFLQIQDTLLTPNLSDPAFGPGPQFTIDADIQSDVQYRLSILALDDGDKAGPPSQTWEFTWKPPRPVSQVPWPARPLPPVNYFLSPWISTLGISTESQPMSAKLFHDSFYGWNATYPVGIRIGEIRASTNILEFNFNAMSNNLAAYAILTGAPERDPNTFLFRRGPSDGQRAGKPLTPFVVYRRQLTNDVFPRVSGDLIQVTPLIEKVPYQITPAPRIYEIITLSDPLFALGRETYGDAYYDILYLRDAQPVTRGARYAYYVVRFKPNREIDEVIPAGEVEVKP